MGRPGTRRTDTRTMFAGSLADVSIGDLFQTLEMAGKASRVEFDTDVGMATVWFRERWIVGARCGALTGADVVYRVAMADEGSFIATFQEEELAEPLQLSPQFVLMEAARRRDEWFERAGEGLRASTRVAVADRSRGESLADEARALVERVGDGASLVDLIPPGDEEALARFKPLRALLADGVLAVVERMSAASQSVIHEVELDVLAPPPIEDFWAVAYASYTALRGPAWRGLARGLALAAMILGVVLAVAWGSGRALLGGLLVGWALIFAGHAASVVPQLPLRRPALVLCEPALILAHVLDRLGVKLGFVGRGRQLAGRA